MHGRSTRDQTKINPQVIWNETVVDSRQFPAGQVFGLWPKLWSLIVHLIEARPHLNNQGFEHLSGPGYAGASFYQSEEGGV
jgi:hypothetical protein